MKLERRTGAAGVRPAPGPVTDRVRTETTDPAQRVSTNAARAMQRSLHTYSALDLGTNNCRLLIAKPTRTFRRTFRRRNGPRAIGLENLFKKDAAAGRIPGA
jgi:hypothetical protein